MSSIHHSRKRKKYGKDIFRLGVAGWVTVLIMSTASVIAVYLNKTRGKEVHKPLEINTPRVSKPAIISTYSGDLTRIVNKCKPMVSKESSFVVFEHGTCVRLFEPVKDPSSSAKYSLKILSSPNLSFVVKPMQNNDYLVVFNEYIFCWLFAKDVADLKQAILADSRLNPSDDDSDTIRDLPDFEQRLGKFARLLLLKDAESLVVRKILKANIKANAKP